ncbi:MAG: hypothetical protein GQ548_05470 [Methylophaga sp.]|nr:hypothetical protein [Methylophaga sp.]
MIYSPISNSLHLRFTVAILSMLLSTLAFYTDDIINSDAILYVYTIEAFTNGGLVEMTKLYNWPFFSIIASLFSQFTHISAELSAKIICAGLFVLFTDALLQLSQKILPSSRHLVIAAVLILSFYTINNYREFIIRDAGYWAFCCIALFQFLCFLDTHKIKHAMLWQVAILVAILFRVEGAVLLAFIPLFVLFDSQSNKIKSLISLYFLTLTVLFIGIILAISNDSFSNAFGKISQITNYLNVESLLSDFTRRADLISNQIMHSAAADYGPMVLFWGLVSITIYSLIKGISTPYLLLSLLAFKYNHKFIKPHYFAFLSYVVLVNVILLIIVTLKINLVTARYGVLTVTILLLILLPTFCQFIEDIWHRRNKIQLSIVALLLIFSIGDIFISSNSKEHVKDVTKWAAYELPKNVRVMTTDTTVKYYFNINNPKATLTFERDINLYTNYDYMILLQKKKNKALSSQLQDMSIKSIYEKSGKRDKSIVYQIIRPSDS